jgi:hypothetical protein
MAKVTWADVVEGDNVELKGKSWTVTKAKRKGKVVKVTVVDGRHTASSEVPAKGKVRRTAKADPALNRLIDRVKRGPTHVNTTHDGRPTKTQQRWIDEGDAAQTKPPKKPGTDVWESPRDRVERKLDEVLGAKLVGEATDVSKGYYVPPVDVTTIASHLVIFHPNTYDAAKDEATMLAGHAHEHQMALDGKLKLAINHWHTKTRPDA